MRSTSLRAVNASVTGSSDFGAGFSPGAPVAVHDGMKDSLPCCGQLAKFPQVVSAVSIDNLRYQIFLQSHDFRGREAVEEKPHLRVVQNARDGPQPHDWPRSAQGIQADFYQGPEGQSLRRANQGAVHADIARLAEHPRLDRLNPRPPR